MTLIGTSILDERGNPFLPMGFNYGHNTLYTTADPVEDVTMGANAVRIIPRGWGDYGGTIPDGESIGDPGGWDPDYITDVIDVQVYAAKANGLKVILARDSNCGINCNLGLSECTIGADTNQNYFNNATKRAHFLAQWDFLAERYYGLIDFYEPAVEPINQVTLPASDVNDLQEEAMDRILIKDPQALFIIGGKSYFNNVVGGIYRAAWATDYPNKIILTCNFLGNALTTDFAGKLENLTDARDADNVPVICQQLGIESSDDADDSLTAAGFAGCLAENVGVIYWEKVTPVEASFGLWYMSGATRVLKTQRYNTVVDAFAAAAA